MIYDNVRRIRQAKGVTASHIAGKLGITKQGYHYIEAGTTGLTAERLGIIADVLGEKVEVFFSQSLTDFVIDENEKKGVSVLTN